MLKDFVIIIIIIIVFIIITSSVILSIEAELDGHQMDGNGPPTHLCWRIDASFHSVPKNCKKRDEKIINV